MKISDLKKFSENIKSKIFFEYNIRNLNWFNIGGKTKVFFRADNLNELIDFLKIYNNRGKIFILGAGSNILFTDKIYNGVVIKLGKNFSNISLLNETTLIAGGSTKDKTLSEFAKENNIGGFEFLSAIPGTVGGGIRMNSGCFESEFKDIIISVQVLDYFGNIFTVPSDKINFLYRGSNLSEKYIFLSTSLKGFKKEKNEIEKKIKLLTNKKNMNQPTRVKTGGSTFKNPITQTKKKVWQLIKESVPSNTKFGDAEISEKHANFFVNKNNAKFEDMKKLISYTISKVKKTTGIDLNLEIKIIE